MYLRHTKLEKQIMLHMISSISYAYIYRTSLIQDSSESIPLFFDVKTIPNQPLLHLQTSDHINT